MALINRFYGELERRLAMIESTESAHVSGADAERAARTLSSLVRSFEKLSDYETAAQAAVATAQAAPPAGRGGDHDVEDAAAEAERWREDLARRLASLGDRIATGAE